MNLFSNQGFGNINQKYPLTSITSSISAGIKTLSTATNASITPKFNGNTLLGSISKAVGDMGNSSSAVSGPAIGHSVQDSLKSATSVLSNLLTINKTDLVQPAQNDLKTVLGLNTINPIDVTSKIQESFVSFFANSTAELNSKLQSSNLGNFVGNGVLFDPSGLGTQIHGTLATLQSKIASWPTELSAIFQDNLNYLNSLIVNGPTLDPDALAGTLHDYLSLLRNKIGSFIPADLVATMQDHLNHLGNGTFFELSDPATQIHDALATLQSKINTWSTELSTVFQDSLNHLNSSIVNGPILDPNALTDKLNDYLSLLRGKIGLLTPADLVATIQDSLNHLENLRHGTIFDLSEPGSQTHYDFAAPQSTISHLVPTDQSTAFQDTLSNMDNLIGKEGPHAQSELDGKAQGGVKHAGGLLEHLFSGDGLTLADSSDTAAQTSASKLTSLSLADILQVGQEALSLPIPQGQVSQSQTDAGSSHHVVPFADIQELQSILPLNHEVVIA